MAPRGAVGEIGAACVARLHGDDLTARLLAIAGSSEKNDAVLGFVARRVALTIPVLLGVATLVFSLIHLIPGDPAQAMLGEAAPEAEVAALRRQLGLDRPLLVQYSDFLGGLVRGDLGTSLRTGTSVTEQIVVRLPATFELAFASMLVALTVALPLGIAAAAWRGTLVDHTAMTVAMAGMSIPNFWLGPLLAIIFAVELGWLPVSGRGGAEHLILPAFSLGLALAAMLARMTRASLLEELREPYVRAARARGISPARAVVVHAFRNSLIPIVTVLGLQFGAVLTGAVITETIFSWPGIGRLLIQSIGFRDYPLVQGCILLIAVTYVAVNLMTDLAYGLLDPRIRYQ
jgi:ABC-type dipeptide/oligopeptide/nickel transport system permease component